MHDMLELNYLGNCILYPNLPFMNVKKKTYKEES